MIKNRRILVVTFSIILLCISLLVSSTYALFTSNLVVKNHLQAGFLDISLVRTNLKYTILNKEGYLEEKEIEENIDFSVLNNQSIFGIEEDNLFIVPGSFFEVELELRNEGNVAIDYVIKIVTNDDVNELSKQIKVTLLKNDGSKISERLCDIRNNDFIISSDEMKVGDKTDKFTDRIEFIDDVVENEFGGEIINNNLAQNRKSMFDLVVQAVQKTNK
jgi:hypothetical protein